MRVFDAGEDARRAEEVRQTRADVKARAEAADKALKEHAELDEASRKLAAQLGAPAELEAVRYVSFRQPGSRWLIEHAKVGKDYVFQIFPLKHPDISLPDVISYMIVAMDAIFPRSIHIKYVPPSDAYKMKKFFTIRVMDVAGLPGWQGAIEKALYALAQIEAW